MLLFEQIFDAAQTRDDLAAYLKSHMVDINDFYNSPYEDLKNEIDSIDNFIQIKRKVLRSLSFKEMYERSFLLILLDLCTRFNLLAATTAVHQIITEHGISCNKRMLAALAYIDPKPSINDEYIDRFPRICELLESAIQEEEDYAENSIVTFLNYWGTVVRDTNEKYIRQLKDKIISSAGTYHFISHPSVTAAIQIDTSDQEQAWHEIQGIVDALLESVRVAGKSGQINNHYLIEEGTNYANEVRRVGPDYESIRKISVVRSNGESETNRGVAILETEPQLYDYMKQYGNMHKAKLDAALQAPFPQEWDRSIDLYDWGCGQGIASMAFLEKYNTTNVNRVTLIEPSEIAIKRAALHVSVLRPKVQIRTICKKLDDLEPSDFNSSGAAVHIHLFSNILDIDGYSSAHLLELMNKCISGENYFVCTSPYIDYIKAGRLFLFMRYFKDNYSSFKGISWAINQKKPDAPYWLCNNMYNGNPCDIHESHASFCVHRWTRFTLVFRV